jgi:ATP-binding cassette subfamily F protein 3
LKGHDFSRAATGHNGARALAPEGSSPEALRPASEPAQASATLGATIVIEGGLDDAGKKRRLNPIKQKQMEDRCAFLEEEIPRIEAAIAHTEEQLGVYVSAAETERLSKLAEDLRGQLESLTTEWEGLMMQLDEQAALP